MFLFDNFIEGGIGMDMSHEGMDMMLWNNPFCMYPFDISHEFCMIVELRPDVLAGICGTVRYPDVFFEWWSFCVAHEVGRCCMRKTVIWKYFISGYVSFNEICIIFAQNKLWPVRVDGRSEWFGAGLIRSGQTVFQKAGHVSVTRAMRKACRMK